MMVILLKILLGLLVGTEFLIGRFIILDWISIRSSIKYEEGTLYSRLIINAMFGFIMVALIMLAIFIIWIIASSVVIG